MTICSANCEKYEHSRACCRWPAEALAKYRDARLASIFGEPSIHDRVADDVMARKRKGLDTYGKTLTPHNGRDALWDAYEEALDLACYLRQAWEEQQP